MTGIVDDGAAAPAGRNGWRMAALLIGMVSATAALVGSLYIPAPQYEPVGGARAPQVVSILILVLFGSAMLRELCRRPGQTEAAGGTDWGRGLLFVFLIGAYALALSSREIGFAIATTMFVGALFVAHERPSPQTGGLVTLNVAVASLVLEFLFTEVFVIDLVRSF